MARSPPALFCFLVGGATHGFRCIGAREALQHKAAMALSAPRGQTLSGTVYPRPIYSYSSCVRIQVQTLTGNELADKMARNAANLMENVYGLCLPYANFKLAYGIYLTSYGQMNGKLYRHVDYLKTSYISLIRINLNQS